MPRGRNTIPRISLLYDRLYSHCQQPPCRPNLFSTGRRVGRPDIYQVANRRIVSKRFPGASSAPWSARCCWAYALSVSHRVKPSRSSVKIVCPGSPPTWRLSPAVFPTWSSSPESFRCHVCQSARPCAVPGRLCPERGGCRPPAQSPGAIAGFATADRAWTTAAPGSPMRSTFTSCSNAVPAQTAWRRDSQAVQGNDLATIMYTSGSTGEPKGVMRTQDNLLANITNGAAITVSAPDELTVNILSLNHLFGRFGFLKSAVTGRTTAIIEAAETKVDLAVIEQLSPTGVGGGAADHGADLGLSIGSRRQSGKLAKSRTSR